PPAAHPHRGRRARCGDARARPPRRRRVPRGAAGPGRCGGVAVSRAHRRHRRLQPDASSPRARAGGGGPSRDDGGRPYRRRRERPPAPGSFARPGVAGDAPPALSSDLAPRRAPLGPPLLLARRAAGARRAGGRAAADDPRVSGAGSHAGGALVTTDVIVVGAGPAGAATAIFLAEHGLAVRLVDRARFPRPKICGEYLSPEAPRLLDRLGALKAVDAV